MDQKSTSKDKTDAPKSAHVIDLRKTKPASTPKPTVKPSKAPKPKKDSPVEPEVTEDYVEPEYHDHYVAPQKRKFWPSFFRFLLLLIILGLIISGGVFFYITYYM